MESMLGMLIFCGGGLAGATFLLPARGIKGWAYESRWFLYVFSGLKGAEVIEKAAITPVPGGEGPMTITMLLWNTLESAKKGAAE